MAARRIVAFQRREGWVEARTPTWRAGRDSSICMHAMAEIRGTLAILMTICFPCYNQAYELFYSITYQLLQGGCQTNVAAKRRPGLLEVSPSDTCLVVLVNWFFGGG